jgi:hypothetical protein
MGMISIVASSAPLWFPLVLAAVGVCLISLLRIVFKKFD